VATKKVKKPAKSVRINFKNLSFVFAKTMPHIPHEYVKRTPKNQKDFLLLFHRVQKKGVVQKWRGTPYRYWYRGDGYKYWTMKKDHAWARIINRAKVDEPTSKIDE